MRIACDQAAGSNSPIQQRFAGELGLAIDRLGFLPHRPNYLMPASWARGFSTDEASSRSLEVQFQVSLKMPFTLPALRGRPDLPVLFFAYTGTAWWQAYDQDRSSPFREYNHAPELFMQWPLNRSFGGLTARKLDTGFEHQSNGRPAPRSRSWNRLFAQIDFDYRERYWVSLRSWWRIPEDAKPFEGAADGDDNPDILRYLGYGALRFGYAGPSLSWNAMLRHGLRHGGKGALEVNVSYPTGFNPRTRWLLRWFDGYGDSLVDYNRRVQRLGIGLMLNDWY
ncbi:MAG: phospholipase A [Burkholderiaceae bacterium]